MKNLKMKSILWFSVATISCGVIVPLAYQAHTYTQKMQTRNQDKQEQIATFKDVDINQLDSLITEQLDSSANNEYKTQLHSANTTSGEYEMPPEINYHEEVKNNALKIISGEYLIIDLQEKFYQEYVGNEEKYQAIVGDYADLNSFESISYSQSNYTYSTKNANNLNIDDIYNLNNLDKIIKNLENYFIGVKTMTGLTTASTVIAYAAAAFYWSAWWMFGGNVPFAISATLQAVILTFLTTESWKEYYNIESDINNLKRLNNSLDYQTKNKISELIKFYKSTYDLSNAITNVFFDVFYYTQFENKILNKLSTYIFTSKLTGMGQKLFTNSKSFIMKTITKKGVLIATSWANPISSVLTVIDAAITLYDISSSIWKLSIF